MYFNDFFPYVSFKHKQIPIAVGSSYSLCTQYVVATTNIYLKTRIQNSAWKPFH